MSCQTKRDRLTHCCESCDVYINWFPGHTGLNPINWADEYTAPSSGVYETKYSIGSHNYLIKTQSFLPDDYFVESNQPAEFKIEWFNGATVEWWVKTYGRTDGWPYVVHDASSATGTRYLDTVAETKEGVIVVLGSKEETQSFLGDTSGSASTTWQAALDALDKDYLNASPEIAVRDGMVNIFNG